MKVAYLHILPVEYYPPAMNTLDILARVPGMQVRGYSTYNPKNLPLYTNDLVEMHRYSSPLAQTAKHRRLASYCEWPFATALGLARWKPDAIISVEPHSSLAPWLYYNIWRGKARLFIHHHEYYAPEDFLRVGMRSLRILRTLERGNLFGRAEWISQTNASRLALLQKDCPTVATRKFNILPNLPPRAWVQRAEAARLINVRSRRKRFVYLGSASFRDTYIREIVEWIMLRPEDSELHICGFNIADEVWEWLAKIRPENVTWERSGWSYEDIPQRLASFDIGLILYKGNTLNFVHNAPNKLFEYLACGLDVWFPPVMEGIRSIQPELNRFRLLEVNFMQHSSMDAALIQPFEKVGQYDLSFVAETALAPLLQVLQA